MRDVRRLAWRESAPHVAAVAAVAAPTFLLAYDGGGYAVESRTATAIVAWWALFLALGLGLVRVAPVPRAALAVGGSLLALGLLTLASALWAPSAEDTLMEANRVSLYLGAFILLVLVSRWLRPESWLDGLALAIVAVAGVALASRFFPDVFSERGLHEFLPSSRKRLSYPVDYWNGVGILAALAVPPLLRLAVVARSSVTRGAAVAPLPAIAAVVYLASSRGAAATALVGGLVFAALTRRRWATLAAVAVAAVGTAGVAAVLLARDELVNAVASPVVDEQGRSAALLVALICLACGAVYGAASALAPRDVRIPRAAGWAVAAALVLISLTAVIAADPVEQFRSFREPPSALIEADDDFVRAHFLSGNGSGRWQFWETAIDQFAANPVTGAGAGAYEAWWAQHGSIATFIRDAHSLYVEMLAELGIAGLLLVLAALAVGLGSGVQRVRARADTTDAMAAATAVLGAYAVAAGIDWMWELTIVTLVAVVCLALVTGPATEPAPVAAAADERSGTRGGLALALGTGVLALLAIGAQGITLLTAVQIEESEAAAARGDLVLAAERADAARRIQPWAASPYLQLALVEKEAGEFDHAGRSIAEAIERDRLNWRLWLVQAQVQTEVGAVREGCLSLLRAAELNPRSPLFADVRGQACAPASG